MSDFINDLIDDAIKQLADDDINSGCGVMEELAQQFAKAGMPIESFYNIRMYIINEAKERTDSLFIDEKIKLAERDRQHVRIFSGSTEGKDRPQTRH